MFKGNNYLSNTKNGSSHVIFSRFDPKQQIVVFTFWCCGKCAFIFLLTEKQTQP